MTVTLLHHTPLTIADTAIGKCWDKGCMPTLDATKERMDRVANKHKHASTIEHLTYNFDIDGISRACLQELARHRISSFSVKSSRYTLKELKEETDMVSDIEQKDWGVSKGTYGKLVYTDMATASKYIVLTGDIYVDMCSAAALNNLRIRLTEGISNDIAKYCMPEAYKTSLVWSVNARSLQNFLSLRSDKAALWEIRNLAHAVFEALPEDHKFLFEAHIKH